MSRCSILFGTRCPLLVPAFVDRTTEEHFLICKPHIARLHPSEITIGQGVDRVVVSRHSGLTSKSLLEIPQKITRNLKEFGAHTGPTIGVALHINTSQILCNHCSCLLKRTVLETCSSRKINILITLFEQLYTFILYHYYYHFVNINTKITLKIRVIFVPLSRITQFG